MGKLSVDALKMAHHAWHAQELECDKIRIPTLVQIEWRYSRINIAVKSLKIGN